MERCKCLQTDDVNFFISKSIGLFVYNVMVSIDCISINSKNNSQTDTTNDHYEMINYNLIHREIL